MRYVKLWLELLALSWRLHPVMTGGMLAIKTVQALVVAVTAVALRTAVNGIVDRDPTAAAIGACTAAVIFAVGIYLGWMARALRIILVEQVGVLDVQARLHADLADLDGLDHLERADVLDRVTALRGAAWSLLFGTWAAVDAVFNAIKLTILLVLLSSASPWLLLLLLFAAAAIWCDRHGQHAVNTAETDTAEAFRLQRHLFTLANEPDGGKEIRVARAGEEITGRQAAAWNEAVHGRFRAQVRAAVWKLTGWTLFTAGFAAGLAMVVHQAATGVGTVGDIVLAITVAVTLRQSVQDALEGVNESMSSGKVIEPYLWLRDYVATEKSRTTAFRQTPSVLRDGITLDRLTFTYSGTAHVALDEVSCHLPAGSVVAIVGEYGSGKTTLVKLLCKFYRPDSGAILLDGTDIADLPTDLWRARTSAVFQDFGRFQTTFAETVGLGDLPHVDDERRLAAAVRAADAESLVDRLPDGMSSELGRGFGGVDLSEGQWQKTALARSSMRTDPLLFVLDEPTASLDAPSEHAIFERYMSRARELADRTGAITVIVSHRFSTVAGADLILVLDKGKLTESGGHDELIQLGGRYADLYGIQATAYSTH